MGVGVEQRTSYPPPVPLRPPATSAPVLEPPSLNVTSSQNVRQEDCGSGRKRGCFSPRGCYFCHTALEKPLATTPRTGSQNPEGPGNRHGSSWPLSVLILFDLANQTQLFRVDHRDFRNVDTRALCLSPGLTLCLSSEHNCWQRLPSWQCVPKKSVPSAFVCMTLFPPQRS